MLYDIIIFSLKYCYWFKIFLIVVGIKSKVKSLVALWEPTVIEESLSFIGWPETNYTDNTESQVRKQTIL